MGEQDHHLLYLDRAGKSAELLSYTQLPLELEQHLPTEVTGMPTQRHLHEALKPYLNIPQLRRLAAEGESLQEALRSPHPPAHVRRLLEVLTTLLRPTPRESITSPVDVAALLMVEMGHLEQEHFRIILLNTKHQILDIYTVCVGTLNNAHIRIAEVYRESIRRNCAAIIAIHNHPSGSVEPSPEDVIITRQLVEAGELLGVECLDHLIIGKGKWCSLRERKLGW